MQDALDGDGALHPDDLVALVWQRFTDSTDLARPRGSGRGAYTLDDAQRKLGEKLRLHRAGRLPRRVTPTVDALPPGPDASAAEARGQLDRLLEAACGRIAAWHRDGTGPPAPQIGIRATVGLGKSQAARKHLSRLRECLAQRGAPDRILVLVPSLALADEAAAAWRTEGVHTAVLRGYDAHSPGTGAPMCRNRDAIRAAVLAHVDVQKTACAAPGGQTCPFFAGCAKQANRNEVAQADVVVAAYDTLYSGLAMATSSIGVILIDEACWQRAFAEHRGLWVESLATDGLERAPAWRSPAAGFGAAADLKSLRDRVVAASAADRIGARELRKAGLDEDDCRAAERLERQRLRDPGLFPGMSTAERLAARTQAMENNRTHSYIALWQTLGRLLAGGGGDVRVLPPAPETGLREIIVTGIKPAHRSLRSIPVLHLDATLRPDLARTILPDLEIEAVEAATPHMALRLVTGGFGKGALCADPLQSDEENTRRANKREACLDYVRWQARRMGPGRVLVITYKDCEAAFAAIPGVETAHFNAVAGRDIWRDVRLLIVIGRPLPSSSTLDPVRGAFFGGRSSCEPSRVPYHNVRIGVRMRDDSLRSVNSLRHPDDRAEVLRAAICDDELLQAIGRGRGVNRTAADPLEVHLLTDVALPLVHDRVLSWQSEAPDIVQRILLGGPAVDSPADMARLRPDLFDNAEQARKAFDRSGFNGQTPISNLYREMSVKSVRYRRAGRGRGWQRAYWIEGPDSAVKARLEDALGPLSGWVSEP